MPRYSIDYNSYGLFVGPAPASGDHFVSRVGVLNNNHTNTNNVNLVKPIIRVQNISFDFNNNYTTISSLGKFGSVAQPLIRPPTTSISFDYLQNGVLNEATLGFYVNYTKLEGGGPLYSNNNGVFLLSGFLNRDLSREKNTIGMPYSYRDCRNIFLGVLSDQGNDFNRTGIEHSYPGMYVIGFGNCYITSYSTQASVGDFPRVGVNYLADNLVVYSGQSGLQVPAVNPKDFSRINKVFNIPSNYRPTNLSVVAPGDITVEIYSKDQATGINDFYGTGYVATGYNSGISDLILDFASSNCQSYSINLNLSRLEVRSLSSRVPKDKVLSTPITANINLDFGLSNYQTGSFQSLVSGNREYDITIKLNNSACASVQGTAVRYDIKRAKFLSSSWNQGIGNRTSMSVDYSVELDPEDLTKGLFISGLLNISYSTPDNDIFTEEGNELFSEESDVLQREPGTSLYEYDIV